MNNPLDTKSLPLLALTIGDPSGIGPEIIVKAWPEIAFRADCRLAVIGPAKYLRRSVEQLQADIHVATVESPDQIAVPEPDQIPVLEPVGISPDDDVVVGRESAASGMVAFEAIATAVDLALTDQIEGIVTAPIHKAALKQAGYEFPGHTEILADRCGTKQFAMMLYVPPGCQIGGEIGLGVVHTTLHQSLRSALNDLSVDQIVAKCELAQQFANDALRQAGIARAPRIAVAAVNPHAGEYGYFGTEEIKIIAPAVSQARSKGIICSGPLPCDTLMTRAAGGEFDMVVAMYHDQGHIALKLMGMHLAVNVTLGLPMIRTSVAHGTAQEIAGTGTADHRSLLLATDVAISMANSRRAHTLEIF